MATTSELVRDRIRSVCGSAPFSLTESITPFDFSLQPTGQIEGVFLVQVEHEFTLGGFNYSEERTDRMEIWVARKQAGAPQAAYRQLVADASGLRAAIVRDGAIASGDYCVPDDGAGMSVRHDDGQEYAVLRLTVPVNYEVQL